MDRRKFLIGSSLAAGASTYAPALAQNYPSQLVRMVVPFSAGSMTDILARALADRLATKWKQQVIVENRPGVAGAGSVARGPADGSQLMLTSNGHTVIGVVNKGLSFDPVKDFAGVSRVATTPSILIAPPNASFKTLQELIATAKAKPGDLSYGSAGIGSSTGIAAELFKQITGTQMVLVPHRGMPESQMSVLRGDTAMCFTFFSVGGDLIQAGQLRALAVTGPTRLPQLPDAPTFAEAGLPAFAYDAWFGVLAPAATPRAIVTQVNQDIAEALRDAELAGRFATQGVALTTSTPEAFDAELRSDAERYGKLVAAASG